ncbi:hypothetical protein L6R52_26530, partial [Myxococcota bacterium]|nr:hypothetical protein [Myxococcota bacterium]
MIRWSSKDLSAALLVALAASACGGDTVVAPLDCEAGTLGCVCARGDVCASTEDRALVCDRGLCAEAGCPAGGAGCICAPGANCANASDECRGGVCRPKDCAAGTAACECLASSCSAGLRCDVALGGGTCVDGTGHEGGACPEAGLCAGATRCDANGGTCVACALGTLDCLPDARGCDAGLVVGASGRCGPPAPPIPESPKCWTRCRADLSDGTGIVRCGPDGLMEGCVGGKECVAGSCVSPGQAPRTCSSDAECPDFQACIGGGCYSNCERDGECAAGSVCHLRVCRVACQRVVDEPDTCPLGTFCEAGDGTSGVCMPLATGVLTTSRREVFASFEVTSEVVSLGQPGDRRSFSIVHDGQLAETFEIVRASERAFDATGAAISDLRGEGSPLAFLELSVDGVAQTGPSFDVVVVPGCGDRCPKIEVTAPASLPDARWSQWEGTLEIKSAALGTRFVRVEHRARPEGRWAGRAHYFASFPDGGLTEWLQSNDRGNDASNVQNGFIRRWGAFRRGRMAGGLSELRAVMTATEEESWRWPSVRNACPQPGGACYLYATSAPGGGATSGLVTYVTSLADAPIPTGHSELELAIHVRADAADPRTMRGRIDSKTSLHMLGDPAIELTLAADPTDPAVCEADGIAGACVVFVEHLAAEITVGGRGPTDDVGLCAAGLAAKTTPWLVPGFLAGSAPDTFGGGRVKTECRDTRFPYADAARVDDNTSLAGANPIPDGNPRRRTIRLLDGALVDGKTLVVLFEERFESFLGSSEASSFPAYGYMVLERDSAVLDAADYEARPQPPVPAAITAEGPVCSPSIVRAALGLGAGDVVPSLGDAAIAKDVADYVLDGRTSGAAVIPRSVVHYYCEDTGLFDGGPGDTTSPSPTAVRVPCPAGSNVRFFAFPAGRPNQADVAALACQQDWDPATGARGTCGHELAEWEAGGMATILVDVPWSCTGGRRFCSEDRLDLRAGKEFYVPATTELLPLSAAIDDAFRYKIRFTARSGSSVGFAPELCAIDGSNRTPYCYAPEAIEAIRDRVDCLLALHPTFRDLSSAPEHVATAERMQSFLSESFGAIEVVSQAGGIPMLRDGFERLHAELLVMLGDEAYTQAFRSRFDLAALRGAAFRGSELEPRGIDLSGVAGFEMASLYQAAQYYQTALDRFYGVAPIIARAIDDGDVGSSPRLVTPATVTWYLDRLIRGSTQRARTWSAIAERYQGFNRPDLARRVLERAYAATHLEGAVLG